MSTSKFEPSRDLLDLHGKVAIVTGGNSGIGFWTVSHLSRRGAKVYMAARNEKKAAAAIERLAELAKDSNDAGEVVWLPFSLDDPKAAKSAAELFSSKESRLDILVNNAGMLASPYETTKDGIVDTMVINHISPFVFVKVLSPLLEQTAKEAGSDVRIVNVASRAHAWVNHTDFSSLEGFNESYSSEHVPDLKCYGKSKLANVIWTKDLQERFDAKNVPITCISLHPGSLIHTEGLLENFRKMPWIVGWLIRTVSWLFTVSPEEGAYTSLFAAASPVVREQRDQFRGAYIVPYGTIETPSALSRDPELAKALWQTTEQILHDVYKM